jgi:hypothetical protein
VNVAGEQNVCASIRPRLDCSLRAVSDVVDFRLAGDGKWLVGNDDPNLTSCRLPQSRFHAGTLLGGDLAVDTPVATGSLDAEHETIGRLVSGLQFGTEGATVLAIRVGETRRDVEEWDVVIAGDREYLGSSQALDESRRALELSGTRALSNVAAHDHEVGPELVRQGDESVDHRRSLGSEVRVGNL